MTTVEIKSFEEIKALLPKYVSLYDIDYRDNLDNSMEIISKCFDKKSADPLVELIDEMLMDSEWDSVEYYIKELKQDLCRHYDIDDDEAQEIIDEYEDNIKDYLYGVDDSTPVRELIRNTDDVAVRVTLYSNYDCINSHHFESYSCGGYTYKDSYFGDVVDVLNLNPRRVKELLNKHGVNAIGNFPNYKWRDGKEYISYEHFFQELENSCCGANNLVFIGTIDLEQAYINDFNITKITIPAGNTCGFYSSFQGGGSTLEAKLLRPMTIELGKPRKNRTEYDCLKLVLDSDDGYSIDDCYGLTKSFWGGELIIN